MQKIMNVVDLNNAIQQLEKKQAEEWPLLKTQVLATYEHFKPMNVIKNSIEEFTASPELKGKIIVTTLGLAAGIVSNTLLVGRSNNPITKMAGTLLQIGISTLIAKNPSSIKSFAGNILSFFTKKNPDVKTL